MNALEKLRETVETLRVNANPLKAQDHWSLAGRLLSRLHADQGEVTRLCKERDLDGLDAIVTGLEHPASNADADDGPPVSEHEMTAALHAFRKRLKLTRLNDESKLGGRQLSGGRRSNVDAIIPPTEFGPSVWRALVRAGKLKDAGGGFYAEA